MENKNVSRPWIKSLIIFSLVLSFLYLILLFILGIPPLFLIPSYFILFFLVFIFTFLDKSFGTKIERLVSFALTKFIAEKKLGMGTTQTSGKLVFSWTQPHGKQEWYMALHYKKKVFGGYFLILFILSETILNLEYGFALDIVLIAFIGSISAVALYSFLLWISSKNWMELMTYEISTEGIYINHKTLNVPLTGLFVPYLNLEKPQFDEKNNIIVLKFKDNKYLRRFVTCNSENYKQVSEYIRERVR